MELYCGRVLVLMTKFRIFESKKKMKIFTDCWIFFSRWAKAPSSTPGCWTSWRLNVSVVSPLISLCGSSKLTSMSSPSSTPLAIVISSKTWSPVHHRWEIEIFLGHLWNEATVHDYNWSYLSISGHVTHKWGQRSKCWLVIHWTPRDLGSYNSNYCVTRIFFSGSFGQNIHDSFRITRIIIA